MIVWLGRRSREIHIYELGTNKKYWSPAPGFHCCSSPKRGFIQRLCSDTWESTTGIKLKPGEIVKCKITKTKEGLGDSKNGFIFEVVEGWL